MSEWTIEGDETMRWDVLASTPKEPSEAPAAVASDEVQHDCECNGSGVYYGRGVVENGVFKGFSGPCYRCNGKGFQTEADRKRNAYYDNHVRRFPSL